MPDTWPALKSTIPFNLSIIHTNNYTSLEKFIEISKNNGLTHLVVDGNNGMSQFLNDVFYNDKKYPYLVKIFDSVERGYKYHVKIYKIDFSLFDKYHS